MTDTVLSILKKTSTEHPTFEMPFEGKLDEGDSISVVLGITITNYIGAGTVTAGTSAIIGGSVYARYSGGNDGSSYLVKVKIQTISGDTLELYGLLVIENVNIPA